MFARPRAWTVVGGFGLAAGFLILLALAGVGADMRPRGGVARPSAARHPEPRTAMQPALLTAEDVPAGYRPAAPPAAPGPRTAGPLASRAETGCGPLFEHLGLDRAPADQSLLAGTLRQAVAVLPAGGVAEEYEGVREAAARCPRFDAVLDDGSLVTGVLGG